MTHLNLVNWLVVLLVLLVLSMLQEVGSPMFLIISQVQKPLDVISVVASTIRGEKVSKETLHKALDREAVRILNKDTSCCH